MRPRRSALTLIVLLLFLLAACSAEPASPQVLRLATTTSTADSGLLDAILPAFEQAHNARVDVVAVGTGQALALGQAGDADVLLVHARSREDEFLAAGHGTARYDVMYNDFVFVGPIDDPADIQTVELAGPALLLITAEPSSIFASRGDDSGTHTKELSLWAALAVNPVPSRYASLGQGMGETLTYANEQQAYTLTDRATFLAQQADLPNLAVLVGGSTIAENSDPALLNPYGVLLVNPDKGQHIQADLARQFAEWLISAETQQAIAAFGVDRFGQPLFYPAAAGQ